MSRKGEKPAVEIPDNLLALGVERAQRRADLFASSTITPNEVIVGGGGASPEGAPVSTVVPESEVEVPKKILGGRKRRGANRPKPEGVPQQIEATTAEQAPLIQDEAAPQVSKPSISAAEGAPLPGSNDLKSSEKPGVEEAGAVAAGVAVAASVEATVPKENVAKNSSQETILGENAGEQKETLSSTGWAEEVARLTDEVDQARAAYAEVYAIRESEKGLWKKVTGIFKNIKMEPDSAVVEAENRYRSKLSELQNAELGRMKEAKVSHEDLKKAMVESLRYFQVDEFLKLYEAQTQAKYIENEKSVVGRMARKTHEFFVWYNKQPLKVKLGVAAAWAGLAGVTAGVGGVVAVPAIVMIGRYGFGGMATSTALNALTEKFAQVKRVKHLGEDHERAGRELGQPQYEISPEFLLDEDVDEPGSTERDKEENIKKSMGADDFSKDKIEFIDDSEKGEELFRAAEEEKTKKTEAFHREVMFENYQKFLDKDNERVTQEIGKWLKKDKSRRWIGRAVGFAAAPVIGKLLSIGMDSEMGKALAKKFGDDFEGLSNFLSQSSKYSGMKLDLEGKFGVTPTPEKSLGDIVANVNVPPEMYETSSAEGEASMVIEDLGSNDPQAEKPGGPGPDSNFAEEAAKETTTSIPSEELTGERAKAVAEYLQEHGVEKNDALWKYSVGLSEKLGIANTEKFAALVEGVVREKIEANPELLAKAGFMNEDLHLMAGGKLNLGHILSAEDLGRIAEEAKQATTLDHAAAEAVPQGSQGSVDTPPPAAPEIPPVESESQGAAKLVDATKVPDDRITFFDGSTYQVENNTVTLPVENVVSGTTSSIAEESVAQAAESTPADTSPVRGQGVRLDGSVLEAESKQPRMVKVAAEVNPLEKLGPNMNEAQLFDYLQSLPQGEQRVIGQQFSILSKQLLELNINRAFTGDMPDTQLFNPNYNPRIWNAEVTTILDHKLFGTGTQNPLHSSQYERLKILVDYARSERGFGAMGAPRPATDTLPGEKLREYLIRLAALSHKTGIPLPRLN